MRLPGRAPPPWFYWSIQVEAIEYDDDTVSPGFEKAVWFPQNNYQSFYEQSCSWSENKVNIWRA
jgi:hypothetical protein